MWRGHCLLVSGDTGVVLHPQRGEVPCWFLLPPPSPPCPSPRRSVLLLPLSHCRVGLGSLRASLGPYHLLSLCLPKSSAHPILSLSFQNLLLPSLSPKTAIDSSTAYQTLPFPFCHGKSVNCLSVCLPIPSQTSPKDPLPQLQSGHGANVKGLLLCTSLSHSLSTMATAFAPGPLAQS